MKTDFFAVYLSKFFLDYLPGSRNVSKNTICSYRDTFTKLLSYFRDNYSISPDKLKFSDLNRDAIENFLFNLETEQNCSISTRNQRLAAIKSFFRYVEVEYPDVLAQAQSILSIKNKKAQKPVIDYMSVDEIKLLLEQPDTSVQKGLRDLAILSLLYDSGARVQELCDLIVESVHFSPRPIVRLYGKGRKSRDVPLTTACSDIIYKYISDYRLNTKEAAKSPLFFNNRREKLSRSGISYILAKYIDKANANGGNISSSITPHCLRHSKAMHMVEAGINLIYIRDFLGHESIETTQVYAKANPEVRRKALEKMESTSPKPDLPDWNNDPDLMKFLRAL